MSNPYSETTPNETDRALISAALSGDKAALQQLVQRHQDFLYNVAWKMVLNPQDAEDITQEVWIKAITHLSRFEGRSSFRTWLYSIAFRHMLRMKRRPMENAVTGFDGYFSELDHLTDVELSPEQQIEMAETIEEVKIGCTAGMLLCLDREQRLVYILGEIFNLDHTIGSEILGISADNYRQRLGRARRDLTQWMHKKCGLINKENPCRCARKTRSFIEQGWVDPDHLQFNARYRNRIYREIMADPEQGYATTEELYARIYREHPFQISRTAEGIIAGILEDPEIKKIFRL